MDTHFEKHRRGNFVEIRSPEGDERADWDVHGWQTFYVKMFDFGFRFPVMRLLFAFCEHYSIHPSQLSPGSIRTIIGVDKLKELFGLKISVEDFNELYFLKKSATENGHFILNLTPGHLPLILYSKGKWKDKYYFARGILCLNRHPEYPSYWNTTGKKGNRKEREALETERKEALEK